MSQHTSMYQKRDRMDTDDDVSPFSSPSTSRSSSTSSTSTIPPSVLPGTFADDNQYQSSASRSSNRVQDILQHYLTMLVVALITAVAITCLFALFLLVQMLGDLLRKGIPERLWTAVVRRFAMVDWLSAITRWGFRLASLADWEETSRASLYPSLSQRFSNVDGDRLYRVLQSFSTILNSTKRRA